MDSDASTVLLHAMAEIRRQQVILAKLNPQTQDVYSDAYAYAVANSVCPILHEDAGLLEHMGRIDKEFPFRSTYRVQYDQVSELAEILDNKWRNKEQITFYDLEDHYGRLHSGRATWRGTDLRMDLIHCCRYFALRDLFGKAFWKSFLSNAPVEANDLDRPFEPDELRPF